MSIRNQSNSHTYSCEYCNGPRTKEGVNGSFCSEECHDKHRGENLLTYLENDHRLCANCGSKLKVVEPPTQAQLVKIQGYHSTKSLEDGGGYQYKTPLADAEELPTVCGSCGNCTLSKPFPEAQSIFLRECARGILASLREKRREGTHDKTIDDETFFEYLETPDDIPLALGRAIDG
ncbi:hypothetical protein SAMN05421858_5106 [Haladaptatus litoreus]|uniref:Uncharacterized protein n=1 Tax=Haladaptatus litoreus TaxID=553468 RepID=A0A1N7FJ12_9EURY|nr:hypothetical protein [Haladaptatus litoreus]SIS00216.1 hypothetical protein SAMN05421858_5106 [Haladaptatus litoreus]